MSSICQPDKANPPQEWRRSCCTSCLTLRHFCHPAACAQQQDHGSCSSSSHAEAMLSAELVSYQSHAVKKNPATLHLLTLWQILRLSIVSDYFCEVRQMKHFSNPGWFVGWKLWSLVQRSYLPLQWGSGKAGKGL